MLSRILILGLLPIMIASPALPAPSSLSCTVSGTKLLAPSPLPATVCARMKTGLEKALSRKLTMTVPALAALSVDIRFARPGSATARLVEHQGQRNTVHPPISVDVMDRALDLHIVDMLAIEVAKQIGAR